MTSLLLAAPLALAALWLASRGTGAELSKGRRAVSVTLRGAAVLLLGAALARPAVQLPGERPWLTVFVADVSDSVPAAAWSGAIDELRRAWSREIGSGNRCALVAFAGRAETLVPPTSAPLEIQPWRLAHRAARDEARAAGDAARATEIQQWRDLLRVDRTDPGEGTRAARALFQESSTSRLVLLTDGRLPAEDPLPAGAALVTLEAGPRRDLAVIDVQAPTAVRAGEPFDVRVTVEASAPTEATLTLSLDSRPVTAASRKVSIARPGRGVVILPNLQQPPGLAPGLHRLLVVAAAPGDDEPDNNSAAAAFATTGKPRVLLVEGRPREGEFLARVFEKHDIDFTRDAPAAAAGRAGVLDEFAVVILAGVPRAGIPPEFEKALASYVERSGGGLWLLGSPSLAGSSGWAKSGLEKLLPVTFLETSAGTSPKPGPEKPPVTKPPPPPTEADPPGEIKRVLAPAAAVLFVVDKSGSMAGPPIEIVKRSCIESAKTLTPQDLMAVIAFDREPDWVLEFTEGDRHDYIQNRVSRLIASGFTSIYPALAEARRAFRADPRARRCSAKHVILLSDGDTSPGDFETLVREMRSEGIGVTAVCVGSAPKFDAALMSQIADWGGGRFIFTHSFKNVPKVFLQEVQEILGPVNTLRAAPPAADPVTKPEPKPEPAPVPAPAPAARLAVAALDAHEALQGVDTAALPGLYGRLDAQARPAAGVAVPLAFSDGKPLLAVGRAGLGRTAVWTSDLASPWSREWHAWKDAGKLAAQVVRSLSAAPPDEDLAARSRVVVRGRSARVRVDPGAPGEALEAFEGDTPLPLARDPDGGASLELALDQPDRLYRVTIRRGADGPTALLGAVRTAEEEFLPSPLFPGGAKAGDWTGLERDLSRARIRTDRKADLSPWLIGLSALLLAIDVAVRRYAA